MRLSFALISAATLLAIGLPAGLAQPQATLYAHDGPHSGRHHSVPGAPHAAEADDHEHGMLEVPPDQPVPSVNLIIHPDARRGWNLEMQVTNFRFAPEQINGASSPQEGHAHLYVDGVKVTRLYGNWYYLESLAPGDREITVSLNANGHEALMYRGQPIQDTERITVQP